ncbi:DNA alkylation repair protein [Paracrocinitomix mangrovi]|uniref:DNA alkylation repair protein n=1 Tax=Paracrocinitomix mangrovi TaxID=2862509 RepID=UPI001C8ECEFA|nr:DNA alkylation repair protein [Paracrocinitomix mangrovi]UKN00716.1 DNA alkylation repair protein [Paracrocinitomix mangrovi]
MELYNKVISTYESHANAELAGPMKAYMKNNFEFYGIKSPLRKEISKPLMNQSKSLSADEVFELVKMLWERPQRELQYFALELFLKHKKAIKEEEDIEFLQWMAVNGSWWDTIDSIAPKLMKVYFDKFPDNRNKKVDEWVGSGNIWLQRCAILIHLKQKENVDLPYMFETILRLNDTNEFFVNKAIGWVLRENAKHQADPILQFVDQHKAELSNLSVREALKHF